MNEVINVAHCSQRPLPVGGGHRLRASGGRMNQQALCFRGMQELWVSDASVSQMSLLSLRHRPERVGYMRAYPAVKWLSLTSRSRLRHVRGAARSCGLAAAREANRQTHHSRVLRVRRSRSSRAVRAQRNRPGYSTGVQVVAVSRVMSSWSGGSHSYVGLALNAFSDSSRSIRCG